MDDEQIYTLRNFQMKGKRVINRGDSVKSRSRTSLTSRRSRLAFVYFMIQKIRKVFDVMRCIINKSRQYVETMYDMKDISNIGQFCCSYELQSGESSASERISRRYEIA